MPPARTALITDSTCDIPTPLREQYGLSVIPLTIVWEGKPFLDGVDLTAEQFYDRLAKIPTPPTTSQPAPRAFLEALQSARDSGAESALILTLSSAMSGTYESARTAAEMAGFPVRVHDSKTNSMGLGWQVLAAARAREAGASLDEMVQAADRARQKMVYIISLDTMEYLKRGGRIGGAVRFLDSILRIKPQISVNHETGKVEAGMPARSRPAAIEGLFRDFFHRIDRNGRLHVCVLHNAAYEEAGVLVERVRAEIGPAELLTSIVSPILGAHTGPRALALVGYAD